MEEVQCGLMWKRANPMKLGHKGDSHYIFIGWIGIQG